MRDKSAKDLAFNRERLKYKKQIDELRSIAIKKDSEIISAVNRAREAESRCEELRDWVDRLLTYTELSEDELRAFVKKEKDSAKALESLTSILGIFNGHY